MGTTVQCKRCRLFKKPDEFRTMSGEKREWCAECRCQPLGETVRPCHDCGDPTTDYRCKECWERVRGGESLETSNGECDFSGGVISYSTGGYRE